MAAIAAVPAIPDETAFMARVADRFRSLRRKFIQVAKKAGNWFIHLTPVSWAWNVAKRAASKVWSWARPAAHYTHRYVIQPAAAGAGAALAMVFGAKLIALLAALGLVGMIAVTVYVVRKRGKEKVVGIEFEEVAGAPEEPEQKPKKPRKPRRKSVITERIEEVLEEVTEALEEQTEAIEAKAKRVKTAAKTVEKAKARVAKTKVEDEPKVETEVETEITEKPAGNVEVAAKTKPNGSYKVLLPEGDLDPNETLAQRFDDLEKLLAEEMSKPNEERNPEYVCELQARQNLIFVRAGKHSEVKKDATTSEIHRTFNEALHKQWSKENPGVEYSRDVSKIYPAALHRGAQAENTRLNKVVKLKAEHDRLKGEAA